jgi:[ribosomal protein S5]-alanine N-acetyltransferase
MTAANVVRFSSFLAPRRSFQHGVRDSTGRKATPSRSVEAGHKIYDPGRDPLPRESALQGTQDESARVRLCRLQGADIAETVEMFTRSADFYKHWVTYPTHPGEVAAFLVHSQDSGVCIFGIRRCSDNALVGIATLSRIAHEPWLTAECGAVVDIRYRGNGYVTEGMRLLTRFAFGHLGLHRIEALVRPENIRSTRMLAAVGFRREGMVRGAICIQDVWVDHVRWAITAEDLPGLQDETTIAERASILDRP